MKVVILILIIINIILLIYSYKKYKINNEIKEENKRQLEFNKELENKENKLHSQIKALEEIAEIEKKHILEYKDNELIVFIDMYTMLLPLFRSTYNFRNELDITSCVINMALHHRNYFKRYGKYAHIFIIYSPTMGRSNVKYIILLIFFKFFL